MLCLAGLLLVSCNETTKTPTVPSENAPTADTVNVPVQRPTNNRVYSNARFRQVTVEKINANEFRVKGEGQIFEASFNWIIEDGHNELKKGFQMTDAGAPEWGKFDFTIAAPQKMPNTTLTLILFETSAKDGSRQYELPVVLD